MRPALLAALPTTLFTFTMISFSQARAADIPCGPVEAGVIQIDGLLEDWAEVPGIDLGGTASDFSFTAKCNYDRDTLYLVVDVRDDYLVRTRAAKPNEDHVDIAFADGTKVEKLVVYPGDSQAGIPHKVYWTSGQKLKGVEVVDSLQPKGWAVEARIALASVPGWSPGAPAIKLGVGAYDSDSKAHPSIETTLTTSPLDAASHLGTSAFIEAQAALDAFLKDKHLSTKDITFDRVARVLPGGSGRVIVAARTLALIGEEFVYLDLPIATPRDILDVRTIDLAGDRRDAVLIRYREVVPTGMREVVAAYRMSGEGLHRAFGVEVVKAQGTNRLESKLSFVKRKAATDIVVEPLPPVGWTEANFRERPAEDVVPILLPWSKEKRARFQFRGEEYTQSE